MLHTPQALIDRQSPCRSSRAHQKILRSSQLIHLENLDLIHPRLPLANVPKCPSVRKRWIGFSLYDIQDLSAYDRGVFERMARTARCNEEVVVIRMIVNKPVSRVSVAVPMAQ